MSAQHWLGDCGALHDISLHTMRTFSTADSLINQMITMYGELAPDFTDPYSAMLDGARQARLNDPASYTATAQGTA